MDLCKLDVYQSNEFFFVSQLEENEDYMRETLSHTNAERDLKQVGSRIQTSAIQ